MYDPESLTGMNFLDFVENSKRELPRKLECFSFHCQYLDFKKCVMATTVERSVMPLISHNSSSRSMVLGVLLGKPIPLRLVDSFWYSIGTCVLIIS